MHHGDEADKAPQCITSQERHTTKETPNILSIQGRLIDYKYPHNNATITPHSTKMNNKSNKRHLSASDATSRQHNLHYLEGSICPSARIWEITSFSSLTENVSVALISELSDFFRSRMKEYNGLVVIFVSQN